MYKRFMDLVEANREREQQMRKRRNRNRAIAIVAGAIVYGIAKKNTMTVRIKN